MSSTASLIRILRRRESIISDHAWRDRDPADHLAALRQVSEEISAWLAANQTGIDPRLKHFLTNASFAKALAFLETDAAD